MTSAKNASSKAVVVSRVIAAFIPGFIFTNAIAILMILLLPVDPLTSIAWFMLVIFALYTCVIMWVFHEPSVKKVWSLLMGGIAASSGLIALVILMGGKA